MAAFLKIHLFPGEPVRMAVDSVVYDGVVSMAPPFPDSAEAEDHPAPVNYRISINQGDVIIDGACRGSDDVLYV